MKIFIKYILFFLLFTTLTCAANENIIEFLKLTRIDQIRVAREYLNINEKEYFFNREQKAREAHQHGIDLLKLAAQRGNPEAMFELGEIYNPSYSIRYPVEKDLIKQDNETSMMYYKKAVSNHHSIAASRMGDKYSDLANKFIISCQDEIKYRKLAMDYYSKSDQRNHLDSQAFKLGQLYLKSEDCRNINDGIKYLEISFSTDSYNRADAAKILADHFYQQKDYSKALRYYSSIVNEYQPSLFTNDSQIKFIAKIQFKIGYMYENGMGAAKDISNAMLYYSKAASAGLIEAQHNLDLLKNRSEKFIPT